MKKIFLFLICLIVLNVHAKNDKTLQKKHDLRYIPAGTLVNGEIKTSLQSFYMFKNEVTNKQYRTFLTEQYLLNGDTVGYNNALPDTLGWVKTIKNGHFEPMANLYFNHPAFDDYPVVNISKKNAEDFCEWFSNKLSSLYPDLKLNKFRLPTKSEWMYAASGGNSENLYGWGGNETTTEKGCELANYKSMYDNSMITVKVDTYNPNRFGLYNMSGNVSEMVSDEDIAMGGNWNSSVKEIQVHQFIDFLTPNPFVGFRPICSFISN